MAGMMATIFLQGYLRQLWQAEEASYKAKPVAHDWSLNTGLKYLADRNLEQDLPELDISKLYDVPPGQILDLLLCAPSAMAPSDCGSGYREAATTVLVRASEPVYLAKLAKFYEYYEQSSQLPQLAKSCLRNAESEHGQLRRSEAAPQTQAPQARRTVIVMAKAVDLVLGSLWLHSEGDV